MGNIFKLISDVSVTDHFSDEVLITVDIDWAHDDVIAECIDIFEANEVPVTWFVTHDTPMLDRIREKDYFELGVHPNFNPLLYGSDSSPEKILDDLLLIVPEAVSIRSHSLFQSSRLMELFNSRGLKYECNHFIPAESQIQLKPWRIWNGLIKVPHNWEDDVSLLSGYWPKIQMLLDRPGLKAFDFHPIHVFLNSENVDRYNACRSILKAPDLLSKNRNEDTGIRTHLDDLLKIFNRDGRTNSSADS